MWGRTRWRPGIRAALAGCTLLSVLTACGPTRTAATFNNPLNPVDGSDPWLLYHDGNYYLTATQWSAIRMWKAPTIAGLAAAKPVTIWSDPTPSRCCNVWAPEFHLLDGPDGRRWYVYYTAGTDGTLDNQRSHVLESKGSDPLGPYTYKGRIYDPANDVWAIDGSVLKMPDGKLYFLFSSWEGPNQDLFIAPMSNPWTISGSRVRISEPTYTWEKSLANVNEGPEALQHAGKTFIVYSASACWGPDYKLGMLTYKGGDVLSPGSWVKSPNPVFTRSDANGVYGPGHNGFFTSPDGSESWIVYHANAAASDGCTGTRTTRVQKFTWNADGTPNFGTPASLDTAITVPAGDTGAPSAQAANHIYYTLVNKGGGKCLDVAGGSSAAEANARLSACAGGANQQWSVNYLGNGYYQLKAGHSGKCLEVAGLAGTAGAPVDQHTCAANANQQWRIEPLDDGTVRLVARPSGDVLDVINCRMADGTHLQQWTWLNNPCQRFRLVAP